MGGERNLDSINELANGAEVNKIGNKRTRDQQKNSFPHFWVRREQYRACKQKAVLCSATPLCAEYIDPETRKWGGQKSKLYCKASIFFPKAKKKKPAFCWMIAITSGTRNSWTTPRCRSWTVTRWVGTGRDEDDGDVAELDSTVLSWDFAIKPLLLLSLNLLVLLFEDKWEREGFWWQEMQKFMAFAYERRKIGTFFNWWSSCSYFQAKSSALFAVRKEAI